MKKTRTYSSDDWTEVEAIASEPCESFTITYGRNNVEGKRFTIRITKEVEDE